MPRYHYERLGALETSLLERETSRSFGHTGATLIFEPGPLATPHGGVDFAAIRAAIEASLQHAPHFRRKLRWIPFEQHPIWVDDPEFNLEYHVRHTSLARPGTREQLQTLAARLQSQRLDRSRPLWECWVLEGLEGGRFALLTKTHNALVCPGEPDLLEVLLHGDPERRREPAQVYRPRAMPTAAELVRDEVVRRASLPRQALSRFERFVADPDRTKRALQRRGSELARSFGYSIRKAPETPLNGEVGPHRRVDHMLVPLERARAVRAALGGTIQDVVLATVARAVALYLRKHYLNPATLDFQVAVPVSVRADPEAREELGGELIEPWTFELPIWESDPLRCFANVRERTEALKGARPALGAKTLAGSGEWSSTERLADGTRALEGHSSANLRLVNVPGPQAPLYLEGARLLECYGQVPLAPNGGLGIAVLSYDGQLCWSLNADFDLVPDLPSFAAALRQGFGELVGAATGRLRVVPPADGSAQKA